MAEDFYTLFMDPVTSDEVDATFQYMEKGEQLKPRLARLKGIAGKTTPIQGENRQPLLQATAEQMLTGKKRLLEKIHHQSLLAIINGLSVKWVTLDDYINLDGSSEAWVKGEMLVILGDYFRNVMGDYSVVISALMEATYGFTRDYDQVWYLLKPLIDVDYNTEPAVLLKENGIQYTVTENALVLCDFTQT